jgi:hypothetical protein
MRDLTYLDALKAARDADVDPLDANRLSGWGWPEREEGLPPPEGSPFRGIVIGLVGAIVLWTVLLYGLAFAAGWRPLRGWF